MQTARAFAERSTCSRAHVGAVFSRDGRILATGYNGTPSGQPHCDHSQNADSLYVGKDGCQDAVHAEANGIVWAARNGVALEHCEVHTTLSPCVACSQLMINAGVFRVVYFEQYRNPRGISLLMNSGISVEWMNEFP